ncbi:MAG: hypothetical protein ACSW8H_00440 [bacterium]
MTATSLSLLVALVVSTIANVMLVSRLRAAKRREEARDRERFW